jgi:hypothetical protein
VCPTPEDRGLSQMALVGPFLSAKAWDRFQPSLVSDTDRRGNEWDGWTELKAGGGGTDN